MRRIQRLVSHPGGTTPRGLTTTALATHTGTLTSQMRGEHTMKGNPTAMATPRNTPSNPAPEAPNTPAEEAAIPSPAAVETPAAPTMPERPDWTVPAHQMAQQLSVVAADLTQQVERYQQYTTAVDLYAGPLRTFVKNQQNPSWANSYRIASTVRAGVEGWAALLVEMNQNIAYIVHELVPESLEFDTAGGDKLRGQLVKILDNADMFITVADDTQVACQASIASWDTAKGVLSRATGKGTVKVVSNTGAQSTTNRVPSRGYGELVRNRGFQLTMDCDRCGQHLTSGSNKGSAQDAVANHFVTVHSEPRPKALDPVHTGFTNAINAVLNAPDAEDVTAQGGTFTIGKEQVAAA